MDAKTYLNQARLLNNHIKSYEDELAYINGLAEGTGGPYYGPDCVVQTQPRHEAPFIKYIDKVTELETVIRKAIMELVSLKQEISATIAELRNPILEVVLRERYINCQSWNNIASDLNYSKVYLYKLHEKAIKLIKVPEKYERV